MSIPEKNGENKIDIREIERMIYAAVLTAGQAAMKEYLEGLDDALAETRDKKRYRDKGGRRTVLKTKLGEVSFSRRVRARVTGSRNVRNT